MNFIESISNLYEYCLKTIVGDSDELSHEEFNARKYNALVETVIVKGLKFKLKKGVLFNKQQYTTYMGLVSDRNSMSEEKMNSISEFLPMIYKLTKIMEAIDREDSACLIYILDPR